MSLPFRDRVVQWAVYYVLNPMLDKRYISTSYGCRMGYGPHSAVSKVQQYLRSFPYGRQIWQGTADASKFFYRIDHDVLMNEWQHIVKDPEALQLIRTISCDTTFASGIDLESGRRICGVGEPIGNLTSQQNANLYLNPLDQYCKHTLRIKRYIRYMDDVLILDDDKDRIAYQVECIKEFMIKQLKLQPNNKTRVQDATHGVEHCGYKIWPDHILLRKSSALRMKRHVKYMQKQYSRGNISFEQFDSSLKSHLGQLSHCDGRRLQEKLLAGICLTRGNGYEYGETVIR